MKRLASAFARILVFSGLAYMADKAKVVRERAVQTDARLAPLLKAIQAVSVC